LIGTFTTTVDTTAAANAAAAAQDNGPTPPLSTAVVIASTTHRVIPTGMTRPKVFSRPFSTVMRWARGRRRSTGWTKA